jgi:hypothetical protein
MKTITIHTGQSIEGRAGHERHPVSNVLLAKTIIDSTRKDNSPAVFYSNSTDFISAMFHYGEVNSISIEFVINGVPVGNDIEKVFEDFNQALDLINEISKNKIKSL